MPREASVRPSQGVQRATGSHYRPDIEGLRAIAVVAVVLFHAEVPGVDGGFVGVDVFFVISGFLITGLLWREVKSTGSVRLRDFYGARARRLLPASATVGVITMLGAAALLPPLRAQSVIDDGIASALYVGNYWFLLHGVDYLAASAPPSPFQHYWSLAVEEQFYLVWPTLIIAIAWVIRRTHRHFRAEGVSSHLAYLTVLVLIAMVSFGMSLIATHLAPPLAFFSLPTRAWQLAVGGIVALTASRWQLVSPRVAAVTGWAGLLLIAVACTQLSAATPYPGTAALLPVVGAALVIGAGCAVPAQGCGRILGLAPMRAIGRLSYSWYLWHWPILLVALWSLAPVMGHPRWLALAGILLSAGLAMLTLRFVENPVRFAAPLRRSASRSLAVGAAATAIAVGAGLILHVPDPVGPGRPAPNLAFPEINVAASSPIAVYAAAVQRAFAEVQAAVAESTELGAVPSNLDPSLANAVSQKLVIGSPKCFLGFFDVRQTECVTGNASSTTKVVLVGDSNAFMWSPALDKVAAQQDWRLETMTKASCPFMDMPIANPINGSDYTECEKWRDEITSRLQAERPQLIVIGMMRRYGGGDGWPVGFTSYEPAWIDSLTRKVRQLRGTSAQVLVLGPIPDPRSSAPDCLSLHLNDAAYCTSPKSKAVNEQGIVEESRATVAGGGLYTDVTDLFCAPDRCPLIVGNKLVYSDRNHTTNQFTLALAPAIGAVAASALAQG